MDVQRLELILNLKRIWVVRIHHMVEGGGWLCGTNLGTATVTSMNESYIPWSRPHEQEDHSITDTT